MNCTITLSPLELHRTFEAMSRHGGGFVSALAAAWFAGDRANRSRLAAAFPEIVTKFGPGSPFYGTP